MCLIENIGCVNNHILIHIYHPSLWADFDCITPYFSPLGLWTIFGLSSESIVEDCTYTNCAVHIIQCAQNSMYCSNHKETKNWTFYDHSIHPLLNQGSVPCDEFYFVGTLPVFLCFTTWY